MKTVLINNPSLMDYSEVIKLHNEVFSKFPGHREYSASIAQERMEKANDSTVMKVFDKIGELIAYSICYERYKGCYHIWQLGVKEENRSKGIASKMYEAIEKHARNKYYKGITINTFKRYKANIHLIEKRGYKLYKKDSSGDYSENPKLMYKLVFK